MKDRCDLQFRYFIYRTDGRRWTGKGWISDPARQWETSDPYEAKRTMKELQAQGHACDVELVEY